jgi:hypothetical protein
MQDDKQSRSRTMKVGIMTFHWAHNYGAILQAYALYQYLQQTLNVEACLIDFITERQKQVNRILPLMQLGLRLPKSVGLLLQKLVFYKPLLRKKSRFLQFAQEFFTYTKHYDKYDELRSSPPELDAVITGSDQVFNYRMLPDQELSAYCLESFSSEKTRKIAFAPSFGNDSVPPEVRSKMAESLMDIQSLSARESNGAILLEELTGRRAEVLFDPVFLHDAEHWRTVACSVELPYSDYILCYALNGRKSLGALAAKIKLLTGLPILLVTSNVQNGIKADNTFYDIGPQEFLWLIDHSKYVVTDSFHGTAFANLYEKNFFSHIIVAQSSQRIIGLLKALGQESRLVKQAEEITSEKLHINFLFSRRVIIEQRKKADLFLRKALFNSIN